METKKDLRKRNLSTQIYESLKEQILTGKLQEGEQLQPIREYAATCEVSKNTVHAAYNKLVTQGYAYAVQGSGYFVGHAQQELADNGGEAPPQQVWCDFTKEMQVDFPWDIWKNSVTHAIDEVAGSTSCTAMKAQGIRQLKKSVAAHILQTRNIQVQPEQLVLCNGIEDAVRYIRELFHDIASEIAFLEPCHPKYRDLFQEDSFQLKQFDRMAKGNTYPEHTFRILFCYLEQFLMEQAETNVYQGWLADWIAQTGSYVLVFDRFTTARLDVQEAMADIREHVLMLGTFKECLPEEVAFSYLVLPEPLANKFLHLQRKESLGPVSYQMALAHLWNQQVFQKCICDWNEKKQAIREVLIRALQKELSNEVRVVEQYSYLTNGIAISLVQSEVAQDVYTRWQQAGIQLECAKDYWYFHKETGENIFLIQAQEGKKLGQAFEKMYQIMRSFTNS